MKKDEDRYGQAKGFDRHELIWHVIIPFSNSTADFQATQWVLDFYDGWILNPLVFGDYPEIMRKNTGSRLPSFTKSESQQVKGSFDFIGVNDYSTGYAQDDPDGPKRKIKDFDSNFDTRCSPPLIFVTIENKILC
ncbi:hypothetical protein ACLOJK_040926 [Asimina triloba]